MEYDREKAEQLIRAEKQMFYSTIPVAIATIIAVFYLAMGNAAG